MGEEKSFSLVLGMIQVVWARHCPSHPTQPSFFNDCSTCEQTSLCKICWNLLSPGDLKKNKSQVLPSHPSCSVCVLPVKLG